MRISFTILLLILQGYSFSQNAFYYQHIKPMNNELFDVAEGKYGYLAVGRSSGVEGDKGFLLYLNKNGTLEWEKKVNLESLLIDTSEYRSITFKPPYFYAIGYTWQNGERKYLFSKINEQGDVLLSKVLNTPFQLGFDNFPSKIILEGESLLVAGAGITSKGTKGELLRLDLDGNIIWKKKYSQYPNSVQYYEYMTDIKKSNNKEYLLEIYSAGFSTYDISTIIKINQEGNELWRKSYDTIIPSNLTNDSLGFISATPYKENHVIALLRVGNSDQYNSINYPREDFALIEYDESGQEISYKRFYNPTALTSADIKTNKENELFIFSASEFGAIKGCHLGVLKLDADKEIKWRKFYKKENPLDTLVQAGPSFENGKFTSDGGFILVAYDFYFEFNGAYRNPGVLKLDCQGDTTWNYGSCLSPRFDDLTIFPNPFSNSITVQLPNIPEQNTLKIKIYDAVGRLIYSSQYENKQVIQINSSGWAEGVYNCVFNVNSEYLTTKKIIKGSN